MTQIDNQFATMATEFFNEPIVKRKMLSLSTAPVKMLARSLATVDLGQPDLQREYARSYENFCKEVFADLKDRKTRALRWIERRLAPRFANVAPEHRAQLA